VIEALQDTRVVVLSGARQVGKSTLAKEISEGEHPMQHFNLDDGATRQAAQSDPKGFISGLAGPVLIDEIQRVPELLLEIKIAIDDDTSPGRFLLTGSSNLLTSKKVNDSLAGRIEHLDLWPLSQSEIEGSNSNLVDRIFDLDIPYLASSPTGMQSIVDRIISGGYPEAINRSGSRRSRWFDSYLRTTLERDVKDLATINKAGELPRLMRQVASQTSNLFSNNNIAQKLSLSHTTVQEYVSLLEQMYLIYKLQGWKPGIGNREATTPKIYVTDSGLLCNLLGADTVRTVKDQQVVGKVFESFVVSEILKHLSWSETQARAYHYQRPNKDVDIILERTDGAIVGIEIKASATIRSGASRWLHELREERNDSFIAGVVIGTIPQTLPLGERLWAVPVSALWT